MMQKFIEQHDKAIYRFFEMVPGVLTWLLFLSPIWLGLIAPQIIIFYITFLTVYWFYLALRHSTGIVIGYKIYKKEMAVDWADAVRKLDFNALPDKATLPKSKDALRIFLLIPTVNESDTVLSDSLSSLLAQTFNTKQIALVFSVEEKFSEDMIQRIKRHTDPYKDRFDEILIYTHPAGIPGEAIGVAGANRTWGAQHGVAHLHETGKNVRDYIFATMDADHVLDRQFFARLVHLYLSTDKRDNHFYSTAVHLFNNNLWEVPLLSRIEAHSVTLGSMADWIITKHSIKETFSNYAASLQTLIDADYWDVQRGVDDTLFYWRSFFKRDGDFEGCCHFIPYSADAVQSDSYLKTHKSMYLQLRRWGWGAISFPLSMTEFVKNRKIPFGKKLAWTMAHIKSKVVLLSIVFLMTFGLSILTLVNKDARYINLVYSMPDIMSFILTVTLVFLVPVTVIKIKLVRSLPKSYSILNRLVVLLEGPLIIVNLFTFSLIPFLDAQTRMLFGRKMKDLYHTPKVR